MSFPRALFVACFACLFFLSEAGARKRTAAGPAGALWKGQNYASEALATLQGTAHRAWSRQSRGWMHSQIDPGEGTLEEWWCRGADLSESTCWTGAVTGQVRRDVAWRSMGTFAGAGDIERLWFAAGDMPLEGPWGVSVRLEVAGTPPQVTDFEIRFVRFMEDAVTEQFVLAPVITQSVEETDFESSTKEGDSGWLAFADLLGSPADFAGAAAGQVDTLLARVLKGIAQHTVRKCSYGRYYGDNQPRCTRVPLKAQEEREWQQSVERDLSHQASLIRSDAALLQERMHAILPPGVSAILKAN